MPDVSTLATILLVHWLVTMSPGPNTLLVAQTAVSNGRPNAFVVIAGICASGAIWVTSAAFGLKAVFVASPWLYSVVRLAGAIYLAWLGLKLLRSRPTPLMEFGVNRAILPLRTSFVRGFVSNITNPKTLVYFSSVFGTFMPPDAGPATVLAVVLITWICNFGWYGGLTVLLSSVAARRIYSRAALVIDRIAGLAMILFGLKAVATSQR
jgi:threonine efflux protein